MKRNTKLLSAGAALVAVTAIAATGLSLAPSAGAEPKGEYKMAMFGGDGHHGMRRHGGRGFGPMGHICSDMRGDRIEKTIGFVETFMTFTAPQQDAWNTLTASVRESDGMVDAACKQLKADGPPKAAPEKLARMEAMMTTGLEVVKKVRPAFDTFYGTLNEKQQQALDELMNHRRGPKR